MKQHIFRAGRFEYPLGERTYLMGILNVTPDSFYDGGRWFDPEQAVERGVALARQGADIVDVGGESTRPGYEPVPAEEELRRVVPVVAALAERGLAVSVDTTKPAVAAAAVAAGAVLINNVGGAEDRALARLSAETGAALVVMHSRPEPGGPQTLPAALFAWFTEAVHRALAAGVAPDRLCLDPGVGFGKTAQESAAAIRALARLRPFGMALLSAPSRKSFLGALTGAPAEERLAGTLGAVCASVRHGADLVRVHDVREARDCLTVFDTIAREPHG